MNETSQYLTTNFIESSRLGEISSLTGEQLLVFVEQGILPRPSYRVVGDYLYSAAFGPIACPGLSPGDYFHNDMAVWTIDTTPIVARHGVYEAPGLARKAFLKSASQELRTLIASGLIPPMLMNDFGMFDDAAADTWIASFWESHLKGIFGVCVRQPGSIRQIVLKETLQVILAGLTNDGAKTDYSTDESRALRPLISKFADACAPFAPVEFARTSRKRFVHDLPQLLS